MLSCLVRFSASIVDYIDYVAVDNVDSMEPGVASSIMATG